MQNAILDVNEPGQRDPLLEVLRRSKQYNIVIESLDRRELVDNCGNELLDFSSCNYISFDQEQDSMLERGVAAAKKYGLHTSRARLMGYHALFSHLERRLADYIGAEDTLLFPNTTLASIGVIPALIKKNDLIVLDKSAHATMYMASQIARDKGAVLQSYKQDDYEALERILGKHRNAKRKIICVDGVYSMTGDYASLIDLVSIAKRYHALIYIDDAHGFGFVGEKPTSKMPYGFKGNGIVNYHGLDYDNVMYVAGTAKNLGCAAAFVSVTSKMKEFLMAYAKPLDYTHPSTPFALGVLDVALDLLPVLGPDRREKVFRLTSRLVEGLRGLGFYVMTKTLFPIISVWAGDTERLIEASAKLYEEGIFLTSCPYPTMPKGYEALRITITSNHEKEHIDRLLRSFDRIAVQWKHLGTPFFPE